MKRGTVNHPKTCALAAELGLEQWGAAGIVAALIEWCQFYAKRGDVGRHPDAAIARGIGWTRDPGALIAALVRTGWLDRCRCHRLRVHDWDEHCDQTVRRSEEVKKHGLIACYSDASSVLAEDVQSTSQPSPSPSPSPSPTPSPTPKPSAAPARGAQPASVPAPSNGNGNGAPKSEDDRRQEYCEAVFDAFEERRKADGKPARLQLPNAEWVVIADWWRARVPLATILAAIRDYQGTPDRRGPDTLRAIVPAVADMRARAAM